MPEEKHISGREATYVAIENDKRRPIVLDPAPSGSVDLVPDLVSPLKSTPSLGQPHRAF